MDIFESKKGGWLILELKGRMDAITAPQVREKIFPSLSRGNIISFYWIVWGWIMSAAPGFGFSSRRLLKYRIKTERSVATASAPMCGTSSTCRTWHRRFPSSIHRKRLSGAEMRSSSRFIQVGFNISLKERRSSCVFQ
jgi:hypothetical protein